MRNGVRVIEEIARQRLVVLPSTSCGVRDPRGVARIMDWVMSGLRSVGKR